ncbi:MAG: hypothetical protein JEZ00_16705 [Anaerolineaceae bacterium]|nr:hypothetical protein [Anaerolineaceae bacterium]
MELKREIYKSEVQRAKTDTAFVGELVDAVHPKRQKRELREMASQTLMILAEDAPACIQPYDEVFFEYLAGKNGFSKMTSLYCITGLLLAKKIPDFSERIHEYLNMLDDDSVMVASHCALNAGKIAAVFKGFEPEITKRFLKIYESRQNKDRKDLVVAYIVEAFELFAAQSENFNEINAFVWQQMENDSPKARQAAQHYLTHFEFQ